VRGGRSSFEEIHRPATARNHFLLSMQIIDALGPPSHVTGKAVDAADELHKALSKRQLPMPQTWTLTWRMSGSASSRASIPSISLSNCHKIE
jgi:hypothetical protein